MHHTLQIISTPKTGLYSVKNAKDEFTGMLPQISTSVTTVGYIRIECTEKRKVL